MAEVSSTKKVIKLSKIQRLIGERMLESKRTKPCFYIEAKANVTELMGMRHGLKKKFGFRITTNSFYIRAMSLAVKEYPLVVGVLDGDKVGTAPLIRKKVRAGKHELVVRWPGSEKPFRRNVEIPQAPAELRLTVAPGGS